MSDPDDRTDWIYLGIKGHVLCLDPSDGRERWRTHLKGQGMVVPVLHGDLVVAHTGGHLFGLELSSGALLWENELAGLGFGHALVASAGGGLDAATVAAVQAAQQAAQQASGAAAVAGSTAAIGGAVSG